MIFVVTLPGGLVLCVPGQYRLFPPLAAIIAASRRGLLATRRWRRCTGICVHLSSRAWRSSSRFWGGCTVLPRCCLSGSPWRLAWHQRSSGSMRFEYAVEGSTSPTHTGSNGTLVNALTGKCKHLMPNIHRGWTGHCSNNQKNFWKNMQMLIQSCHSVKIDLGERPPIVWFRSSTIPLDLALNVCPR